MALTAYTLVLPGAAYTMVLMPFSKQWYGFIWHNMVIIKWYTFSDLERGREGGRGRERERERERERQTDRQTDRQTETDRQRQRQRE